MPSRIADLLPDRETVIAGWRPGRGGPPARPPDPARRGGPHLYRRPDARGRRHRDDAGGLRRRRRAGAAETRASARAPIGAMPARTSPRARVRSPPGGGSRRPISASPRRSATSSCRCSAACGWHCCRPATRCASRASGCRRGRSMTPTASCCAALLEGWAASSPISASCPTARRRSPTRSPRPAPSTI